MFQRTAHILVLLCIPLRFIFAQKNQNMRTAAEHYVGSMKMGRALPGLLAVLICGCVHAAPQESNGTQITCKPKFELKSRTEIQSRQEVDDLVRSTLQCMASGGRFMLYPIPGLYGGCPWEKVEWLIESWKKYA
jgi:hypothetical protein